jgi:integrase/recombinase XerD
VDVSKNRGQGPAAEPGCGSGRLRRLAMTAGVTQQLGPHMLRRTFCTAGLVGGVPSRDMQYAMRHADSRTTLR